MKKYLLSIGEVSSITGVHISSLRYYDKIGVLKPAYIDPFTNYRYYSYSQVEIVNAIQTCIALGIPLKEYNDFINENKDTINAEKLLEYAMIKAEEKLKEIKNEIRAIERYQADIKYSKRVLKSKGNIEFEANEKCYYVTELNHRLSEKDYKSIDKLPHIVEKQGYTLGNEYGLLYLYSKNSIIRYQFIEVESNRKQTNQNIIIIPKGKYITKIATPDKIETADTEFKELFDKNKNRTVILTELFTENIDVNSLVYELRCYL